jgi:hypothetical protein
MECLGEGRCPAPNAGQGLAACGERVAEVRLWHGVAALPVGFFTAPA